MPPKTEDRQNLEHLIEQHTRLIVEQITVARDSKPSREYLLLHNELHRVKQILYKLLQTLGSAHREVRDSITLGLLELENKPDQTPPPTTEPPQEDTAAAE